MTPQFEITQALYDQLQKAAIRSYIRTSGPKLFLDCITCDTLGTVRLSDHFGPVLQTCPDCDGAGEFELVVADEIETNR